VAPVISRVVPPRNGPGPEPAELGGRLDEDRDTLDYAGVEFDRFKWWGYPL